MAGEPAPLTLVCCNGVGVSTFFWKYIVEHYRQRFQVMLWDYRGHGRSGSPVDIERADLTVERSAEDLQCVLDAAGIQTPIVLLGHSMGVQVILEYYRRYPDVVRALVPMFGTYGRPLDSFMGLRHARRAARYLSRAILLGGKRSSRLLHPITASPLAYAIGRRTGLVDRYYANRSDVHKYLEHLNKMDPRVFARMVDLIADHDLEPFLPEIDVPTLVFGADQDLFTPLECSLKMARDIPNAELLVLADGSHAAIVEYPDTINRRLDRFLAERVMSEPEP